MSHKGNQEARQGIGIFLLKTAWLWGSISLLAGILLYKVSYASLKVGLFSSNAVSESSSGLLAIAFNLLEIVGIAWIFIDELGNGETDKDTFLDWFVKVVLGAVLVGDMAAIFYATGYTINLPGNPFGNVLTIVLRAVGAIIGGAGSESFLILGGLIIWVWWGHKFGITPSSHATPAPKADPAPAPTGKMQITGYKIAPNGQQRPGQYWFPAVNSWGTKEQASAEFDVTTVETQAPAPHTAGH